MTATIIYDGGLRTTAEHLRSGSTLETDAPVDNQGKGERFSPTDLVAVALSACMATTMAIRTEPLGIDLKGARFDTEKVMAANPRRISEIRVRVSFPGGQHYSAEQQQQLKEIAESCPVFLSLHPDLKKSLDFQWN